MKKSQVSHVLIFALGIVILSLILFFGYKVVQELRAKGEETDVIRFKTKLVNDIKVLKEGDATIKSYIIPKGYSEVCFTGDITQGLLWCSEFHRTCTVFSDNEPELSNAIEDNVRDNVFLAGESKIDSFFAGNIDLGVGSDFSGGYGAYAVYCFEIKNSRLNIMLTGQGDSVLIQKPE